jgi:hypothetical protein
MGWIDEKEIMSRVAHLSALIGQQSMAQERWHKFVAMKGHESRG